MSEITAYIVLALLVGLDVGLGLGIAFCVVIERRLEDDHTEDLQATATRFYNRGAGDGVKDGRMEMFWNLLPVLGGKDVTIEDEPSGYACVEVRGEAALRSVTEAIKLYAGEDNEILVGVNSQQNDLFYLYF